MPWRATKSPDASRSTARPRVAAAPSSACATADAEMADLERQLSAHGKMARPLWTESGATHAQFTSHAAAEAAVAALSEQGGAVSLFYNERPYENRG